MYWLFATKAEWLKQAVIEIVEFDTDHGFDLLAGQVVHDGTAHVPQLGVFAEQGVHRHLGGDADVGDLLARVRPLADVHQPLRGGQVLKHVAHLKDNTNVCSKDG